MLIFAIVIGLAAALLFLMAGYLFGARQGREARAKLQAQAQADAEEMTRLRERASQHQREDGNLRAAIHEVLRPLVKREQLSMDLARLEGGQGQHRDLTTLLDQMAEKGNFQSALLSDDQGWPLATSTATSDPERLAAMSSLLFLLADRMGRDGAAAPLSLMVHDADNMTTLCRLFKVENQRLSLTVVASGSQLSPAALDPVLVRLNTALLGRDRPNKS